MPTDFIWDRRRLWVVLAIVALSAPVSLAHAGSLGDYKDEKHDSNNGGWGSSDDDDDEDSDDDETTFGDVVAGILGAAATSEPGRVDTSSSSPDPSLALPGRPCRYEFYHSCLRNCPDDSESCRGSCRRQAASFCGVPSTPVGGGTFEGKGLSNRDTLGLEAGVGFVEDGVLATMETRLAFGYFGISGQISGMWNRTDWLLESDFGPALFFPNLPVEIGVQPSALISAGNDVESMGGFGMRLYSSYTTGRVMFDLSPMAGLIGDEFNLHTRSGIGYRFPRSAAFIKAVYDFRWVLDTEGPGSAVLHGGFLSVGLRHP